jgi:hypothetical protein
MSDIYKSSVIGHEPDLAEDEREILKQAVKELAQKIMKKCDRNSDDGLQKKEAQDFLKDLLRDSGILAFS